MNIYNQKYYEHSLITANIYLEDKNTKTIEKIYKYINDKMN